MQRISIRRQIGTTQVGQVIPGIGTVQDMFRQGDKQIRICRLGDFGQETQAVASLQVAKLEDVIPDLVTESAEPRPQVAKPKKPKLTIAPQKKNKVVLDESPSVNVEDNKQILRG